jgi:F-type H+-transporting ATPase subunit a
MAGFGDGMILADADFSIHGLYEYELFGHKLWITTTHVALLVVDIFLITFFILAGRRIKKATLVPKGFQNVIEILVETIDNMVEGIMGKESKRFRNYIGCLFIFLFFANISGLWGLRPPTADYGVTFPLGVITFFMVQICGIKKNKFQHFAGMCKPVILTPINIIGEIAVPISLSLRLFGNIMSGTVMMGLIYGLLPKFITVAIPAPLHIYFDIFSGAIQAYVFCMLTMVYISDKILDEE